MKQSLFQRILLVVLLLTVSWASSAKTVYNKGNITIYVGEQKTLYHNFNSTISVSSSGWFIRQTNGNSWTDAQEDFYLKIVSRNSQSCTIEGLADNSKSDYTKWELHCLSEYETYECYWTITVKSYGSIYVDATPNFGPWYYPTMVEKGSKVYLTATINNTEVSDAKIYYTTDGSDANQNSTLYTSSGITITKKTYLSAIAKKSGYSPVICGGYYDVIEDILVTSITLNKTSLSLQEGQEETLQVTVKPDNATNKTVTWTSSNTSVATVDGSGKVTAKAKGSATITCKANDGSGKSATCSVTVTDPIIEPTAITISPSSKTINVGDTFYASYTLTPSNATTTVTWSSDNTSIATVTQSGLVTGVAAGSTYINVRTANGKTDYFRITVNAAPVPVESIKLYYSFTTVELNKTKKLTYTLEPSDANPSLTWTSSDTSVATVAQDGTVTGKKQGTARITVTTDNGKSSYCDVKVVKFITAQTVEGATMTFQVLDETEKTCQAGGDPDEDREWYSHAHWAVPYTTSGNVTIPSSVDGYTVTAISELAFLNHKSMTSVSIPNTVKSIGYAAFKNCTKVESFVIPNSVTETDGSVFEGCSLLKTVTLSNSLTTLSYSLFEDDTELTSVEIPSSITEIYSSAFRNTGLREITIPSSVTYIGWSVFKDCMHLEKVTSLISEPFTINKNVFENEVDEVTSFTNATLYVPRGTKSAYESTDGWKEFSTIIEMGGGLKGDVNEDGYVNGTDLVALTNIILGKSAEKPSADVNGDGYVNGTDYVALANIILGKANARRMTSDNTATGGVIMSGTAMLHIKPFDIRPGETREMAVSLTNPDDALTLLQFDLLLPQGLMVERDADGLVADMAGRTSRNSHQLCAYGDGGNIRFLLASAANELIDATEGTVIRMRVTADAGFSGGTITLHDILGVSPNEQEVTMPDWQYAIAGGTDGIYSISDAQKGATVYSLTGQRLHSVQKGINIINGKKIIKK